jgi:ABC-type glycerol-3-phosphate transport system substrate-binding protein
MSVNRTTRMFAAAFAMLIAAACSSAPSPQEASYDREIARMQPMRGDVYSNAVTGFDISGTRMDVSIDLNQYSLIDDDADDAIKRDALNRWKDGWRAENSGKHATLTVRLLDYHGKPWFTETATV